LDDPRLQQLAIDYGFRINDPAPFRAKVQASGVKIPGTIVDLVEPPSYEPLEHMIVRIEELYGQAHA
jgi:hypothetical protein